MERGRQKESDTLSHFVIHFKTSFHIFLKCLKEIKCSCYWRMADMDMSQPNLNVNCTPSDSRQFSDLWLNRHLYNRVVLIWNYSLLYCILCLSYFYHLFDFKLLFLTISKCIDWSGVVWNVSCLIFNDLIIYWSVYNNKSHSQPI